MKVTQLLRNKIGLENKIDLFSPSPCPSHFLHLRKCPHRTAWTPAAPPVLQKVSSHNDPLVDWRETSLSQLTVAGIAVVLKGGIYSSSSSERHLVAGTRRQEHALA